MKTWKLKYLLTLRGNLKRILILTGLVVTSNKGLLAQSVQQDRPNIIFIMADDHALQALSAYDSSLIKTPNIDRIAQQGVLFRNAFVTNSICGPSRATILTGKYSHINGFKDNPDRFDGSQETFPKILRKNGYKTAIIGKWHLKSEPTGFDYYNVLPGQGHYYNPNFKKMGKDTIYKGYITNITTDLAIDWLDSNKNGPFMLMLHHKAPHRNQMPPLDYLDLYNDRDFQVPANFNADYKNQLALQRQRNKMSEDLEVDHDSKMKPSLQNAVKRMKRAPAKYERDLKRLTPTQRKKWDEGYKEEYEEFKQIKTKEALVKWQYQRYMEDYLRTVKSLDDNIGRLLKYLDENGLSDNTVIVYTSDQGAFLGEHGIFDKRFMYEESLHTPLLISYPEKIIGGREPDEFVLNLDIAPTLLDLAGLKSPTDMQGRSMKDILLNKKQQGWRDKIYYHYYGKAFGLSAHYGIRTKRYKLIHFYDPIDSWELYDLEKDPNENENFYNDPLYKDVVEKLQKALGSLQDEFRDTSF